MWNVTVTVEPIIENLEQYKKKTTKNESSLDKLEIYVA